MELPPSDSAYMMKLKNQMFKEPHQHLIENIARYPDLRSAESLTSTALILDNSITNLPAMQAKERAAQEAVEFNKKLVEVLQGETRTPETKE